MGPLSGRCQKQGLEPKAPPLGVGRSSAWRRRGRGAGSGSRPPRRSRPARVHPARGSGGARTPPPAPRHLGALRRSLGTAPTVAPGATHPRCPGPGPPSPPRPPPRPGEAAARFAGRPGRSPCPGRAGPKPRDARTQPGRRSRWHKTPPPAPWTSADWLRRPEAPPRPLRVSKTSRGAAARPGPWLFVMGQLCVAFGLGLPGSSLQTGSQRLETPLGRLCRMPG